MTLEEYRKECNHCISEYVGIEGNRLKFVLGTGESRDFAYDYDIYFRQEDTKFYYELKFQDFFNICDGQASLKSPSDMKLFLYDAHLFYIKNIDAFVSAMMLKYAGTKMFNGIDWNAFQSLLESATKSYTLWFSDLNVRDKTLVVHSYTLNEILDTFIEVEHTCYWGDSDEPTGLSPFFYWTKAPEGSKEPYIPCAFADRYAFNVDSLKTFFLLQSRYDRNGYKTGIVYD